MSLTPGNRIFQEVDKPFLEGPSSFPYQSPCYAYTHAFKHKHSLNTGRWSNWMLFKCCDRIITPLYSKQKYLIFQKGQHLRMAQLWENWNTWPTARGPDHGHLFIPQSGRKEQAVKLLLHLESVISIRRIQSRIKINHLWKWEKNNSSLHTMLGKLNITYMFNNKRRTSLVAHWLGIRLPKQETQVQSLVREDPTCCRATKPAHHNYWACALEPTSHNYWSPHA